MSTQFSGEQLLQLARRAAERAYAPYSRFRVGAAVVAGARVYEGCNIENASFGLTVCAERVALFKAASEGERVISQIALACIDAPPDALASQRMPCGACRQVMAELGAPDLRVWVDGVGGFRLVELLPEAFRLSRDA